MPAITILILSSLFMLALGSYFFLKERLPGIINWVKLNLILLATGLLGSAVMVPFIIPHDFTRNIPVLTLLPLIAYNVFFLLNALAIYLRIGKIVREVIGFFSILLGIITGSQLVNLIGFSYFRSEDIKDAFLLAFFFNTARMLLTYANLLTKFMRKKRDLEQLQLKEADTRSHLDALNSKLHPHFLYNALNSIAGLAMVDGKKTKDMTMALSKLLRYSLDHAKEKMVTVEEEMDIVRSYFAMEKIRLEESFHFEISIEKRAEHYLIPRFILQPLVENCIKHAFTDSEHHNFIKINVSVNGDQLSITIHDNGTLFPEKLVPGYGLKNVSDKLQLLLPAKHSFQISNIPVKEIVMILPVQKK